MERVHMVITGLVQGVGYRKWAKRAATSLAVVGYVKNREDGSVEICAEGNKSSLQAFVLHCHSGPEVSFVEQVSPTWLPASNEFTQFEVIC